MQPVLQALELGTSDFTDVAIEHDRRWPHDKDEFGYGCHPKNDLHRRVISNDVTILESLDETESRIPEWCAGLEKYKGMKKPKIGYTISYEV